MKIQLIRKALDVHLSSLTPVWATVFENQNYASHFGSNWQRVQHFYSPVEAIGLGQHGASKWRGLYTITVVVPPNTGTSLVHDRVDALVSHFYRGLTLQEINVTNEKVFIKVTADTYVSNGLQDTNGYSQTVKVPWYCYFI